MIFETHAHYDDERFEEDRDALITSMPGRGVGTIINVGASIESTKTTLALSEKYPFVYAAVGVHPSDISGLNEETFAWLKEQTKKEKVAAIFLITNGMYEESFRSPRCGSGAIYGQSVSRRIRSSGISCTVSFNFFAFLKVTTPPTQI